MDQSCSWHFYVADLKRPQFKAENQCCLLRFVVGNVIYLVCCAEYLNHSYVLQLQLYHLNSKYPFGPQRWAFAFQTLCARVRRAVFALSPKHSRHLFLLLSFRTSRSGSGPRKNFADKELLLLHHCSFIFDSVLSRRKILRILKYFREICNKNIKRTTPEMFSNILRKI